VGLNVELLDEAVGEPGASGYRRDLANGSFR